MKIERPALIEALTRFSRESGLVVGVPGVGKSHSLRAMLLQALNSGECVAVLPVSHLQSAQEAELRSIYGYPEDDFISFLDTYGRPHKSALLVVDGYDAARDPHLRSRILTLLRRVKIELPKWHVVVSARLYDARHSAQLLSLFQTGTQAAAPYHQPDLAARHFLIPRLSIDEVTDALGAHQALSAIADRFDDDLMQLLQIPFNLQLLERIADAEGDVLKLAAIEFQVQLLQEYWNLRVAGSADHLTVERCLVGLTQQMIRERGLSVPSHECSEACAEGTIQGLASAGVLARTGAGDRQLGYSHNVLFDFAVQALLLSDRPQSVDLMIREDEARALYLRPSFEFHFSSLWVSNRPAFWATFKELQRSGTRGARFVGRVIPAAVAAEGARNLDDLHPLVESVERSEDGAVDAVRIVLQAREARSLERDDLWLSFLAELSTRIERGFVNELARAARGILGRTPASNTERRKIINEIGIRLLRWARSPEAGTNSNSSGFARAWLIPLVTDTYASDSGASRTALEPIVGDIGTDRFDLACVGGVCNEIPAIVASDPEFAEEVYGAVFSYEEKSTEQTVLSRGILPMSSNRAQDYQMCQYSLAQAFDTFLLTDPERAVSAALRAVSGALSHEPSFATTPVTFDITFRGRTFEVASDYRSSLRYRDHHARDIAKMLLSWMTDASRSETELDWMLDGYARFARHAELFIWLLKTAAEHPTRFFEATKELATSPGILQNLEIDDALQLWLSKSSPFMSGEDRTLLSERIGQLPTSSEDEELDYLVRRKARLLAILDGSIAVEASSDALDDPISWTMGDEPMPQVALARPPASSPDGDGELGVLTKLKEFNARFRDRTPSEQECAECVPEAQRLLDALKTPSGGSSELQEERAVLAEFVGNFVFRDHRLEEQHVALCESIVYEVHRSRPERSPKRHPTSDRLVWIDSPEVRLAQSLCALLWHGAGRPVESMIQTILDDGTPDLRYQLANRANCIKATHPRLFWSILRSTFADGSTDSREMAASGASQFRDDPLAKDFAAWAVTQDGFEDSDALANLITYLAFRHQDVWGKSFLSDKLLALPATVELVGRLVRAALRFTSFNVVGQSDWKPSADEAMKWLLEGINQAERAFKVLALESPSEAKEKAQADVYKAIPDAISSRLYFHVTRNPNLRESEDRPMTDDEQGKAFAYALPAFKAVVEVEVGPGQRFMPASTAHHVVELLVECVNYDPATVVALAAETVASAVPGGYSLDPMALKEVLALVESLLADHREVLASTDGWRSTMQILEAFVDTGFAEAMQLVFRLEDVFR